MSAAAIPSPIPSSLSSKTIGGRLTWAGIAPRESRSAHAGLNQRDAYTLTRLDSEVSLVERCLGGEQAAWEELVKLHTKRVYALCYRFTSKENEAQDLTQEVFLRVFKTLQSFRAGEGSLVVWLTRLTRNLLVDHYRRTKNQRVTDNIEDKLLVLEEKTGQHSRADGLLAAREAGEVLQAALQKLSPELREAVILRDLQEMEYREIARVLSVPEGTVKSRLNRGRAELVRVLRRNKVAV